MGLGLAHHKEGIKVVLKACVAHVLYLACTLVHFVSGFLCQLLVRQEGFVRDRSMWAACWLASSIAWGWQSGHVPLCGDRRSMGALRKSMDYCLGMAIRSRAAVWRPKKAVEALRSRAAVWRSRCLGLAISCLPSCLGLAIAGAV